MQDVWINGVKSNQVGASDRGLSYGDGLFETIAISDSHPELLDAHFKRLALGLDRLGFPDDVIGLVKHDLSTICLEGDAVLKITVTRGVGLRGYALPPKTEVTRIISVSMRPALSDNSEKGVAVRLCNYRLPINPVLAQIKHLNRLDQVMARSEWDDQSISEGIVLDAEGYIVEGTMSNLFWVASGIVYTPLIDRCGVKGVMRDHLLSIMRNENIAVEQVRSPLNALLQADEVFICNSLIGIWPVIQIDDREYAIGPMTRKLQQLLSRK